MDNIFLSCRKQTVEMPFKFCKWEGVVGDYVQHVKKNHRKSYYVLKPGQQWVFQWTLPQVGDQMDRGVIACNEQHFIYKIAYGSRAEEFKFTLQNIEGDAQMCCFTLLKTIGGKVLKGKKYFKTNSLNANDGANGVVISRPDIDDFTDTYGSFVWSLSMDCCY